MPVAMSSSFPDKTAVNLRFRPHTYVAEWCCTAASVQNVTGEWRRRRLLTLLSNSALQSRRRDGLLQDVLLSDTRETHIAADPLRRIAGEYLPPYLPGELEIARIVLGTTPAVVYSLRARSDRPQHARHPTRRSTMHAKNVPRALRMVDEQGSTFTFEPPTSNGTMTLRELIRVIDSVRAGHIDFHPEHVPFPEALLEEGAGMFLLFDDLLNFVHISSLVYPELNAFYRIRAAFWLRRRNSQHARVRSRPEDRLAKQWTEGRL